MKYGSNVYTDEAVGYDKGLQRHFMHEIVNHTETYVHGQVHTNGIENFWSLLKRTLKGTYVAVEPFHLERYVDEQVFRDSTIARTRTGNKLTDVDRFNTALLGIAGRRLTFAMKLLASLVVKQIFNPYRKKRGPKKAEA